MSYHEPLFETRFILKQPPQDERIKKAIAWGRLLSEQGFCPSYGKGSHGNLSFRTRSGMIITATQTDMGQLTTEDFVEVTGCEGKGPHVVVSCKGKKIPSTDTLIHFEIYQKRSNIHAHDQDVVDDAPRVQFPQTAHEKPSGSLELFHEIEPLLHYDYIVIQQHGVLSLGKTLEDAGKSILVRHNEVL